MLNPANYPYIRARNPRTAIVGSGTPAVTTAIPNPWRRLFGQACGPSILAMRMTATTLCGAPSPAKRAERLSHAPGRGLAQVVHQLEIPRDRKVTDLCFGLSTKWSFFGHPSALALDHRNSTGFMS